MLAGSWGRIGAIATMLLCVGSMAVPWAAAAPAAVAPGAIAPPQSWAYGGQEWANTTVLSTYYSEAVRAFYGWQVVTVETNTTANLTEFQLVDTYADSYYVQYCAPNCTNPLDWENLSMTTWEVGSEFVNLTSAALVRTVSGASPAFGIVNASSGLVYNLSEVFLGRQGGVTLYSGHDYVEETSTAALSFGPPLGLLPHTSTTGETWNASSAFAAAGGWVETYDYLYDGATASYVEKGNGTYGDTTNGTESVEGADLGPVTLASGAVARSITLAFTGPYDVSGGLFILPAGADLFGGANENWSVQVHPASAIETNQIDVATSGGSNTPEIIASSTNWTVGSTSPSGPSTSSSAAPPTAGGTVQGQPEPLPYAQATSRCLVGICPSSSAGPASAGAGPPTAAYLAWGAAAGVGAGAAAVWLARRPRPPSAGRGEGLPPGAPEHAVPFPPDR